MDCNYFFFFFFRSKFDPFSKVGNHLGGCWSRCLFCVVLKERLVYLQLKNGGGENRKEFTQNGVYLFSMGVFQVTKLHLKTLGFSCHLPLTRFLKFVPLIKTK